MPRPKSEQPTPGELEVLQVLWERGPATVREVHEALHAVRPRGYTSVMSLLNVMVDKRLLRRKPEGRAYRYAPRVQRQPTLRKMVADLLDRAFGGAPQPLLVHLLEETDPSPEQLADLEQLIAAYRARQEGA